ncbi:sensor histidine kinase [Streptomyces rishiriensis]|uniref:sensor histidine kinase n=1 Tax=Streptomyces rishiriensis TaxID=68264 RepID=UPI0037D893AE
MTARDLTVLEGRIDDSAWVWGNQTLLRRAVDNVIDNAIAHNDPGGWISVAARAEGDDPSAVSLVIESSGPVLDQRRVADLAQPFRRLGADRTGTGQGSGLGLSIVAAITQAHHGTLDLRARSEGGLRSPSPTRVRTAARRWNPPTQRRVRRVESPGGRGRPRIGSSPSTCS